MSEPAYEDALRQELERRIAEVSTYPDEAFGRINPWEWVFFCLLAVLLPLGIVWGMA